VGNRIVKDGIEAQTVQALGSIKTLVEDAGDSLADVCRIVVFVTVREYVPKLME